MQNQELETLLNRPWLSMSSDAITHLEKSNFRPSLFRKISHVKVGQWVVLFLVNMISMGFIAFACSFCNH